jgi:TRAP-type transport system small permease protein
MSSEYLEIRPGYLKKGSAGRGLGLLFKISDGLDFFAKGVSLVFLSLITAVTIAEVLCRTFFSSLTWSEEVTTTFLGTWFIFIGVAVPLKRAQLVSIQLVESRLPARMASVVTSIGQILIMFFLLVGVKYGLDLVALAINQPSPTLMYPMGYAYLGIPVGCMVMLYQTLILMVRKKSTSEVSTTA